MESCQVDRKLLIQTQTLQQKMKEIDKGNQFGNNIDSPQDQTSVELNTNPTEVHGASYFNLFTETAQNHSLEMQKQIFEVFS